jgi:hypothetical protein
LNERHRLAGGCPVNGFLCGSAFQSIPESLRNDEFVGAKLVITDVSGYTAGLDIGLTVDRRIARARMSQAAKRKRRSFDKAA